MVSQLLCQVFAAATHPESDPWITVDAQLMLLPLMDIWQNIKFANVFIQCMCWEPPGEVRDCWPAKTGPLRPLSLWRAVKEMKHYSPLTVKASREGDASLRRGLLTHYRWCGRDALGKSKSFMGRLQVGTAESMSTWKWEMIISLLQTLSTCRRPPAGAKLCSV